MNSNSNQDYLILTKTDTNITYKTPHLFEVWNWEGDESILPYKWADIIKKSLIPGDYTSEFLKSNFVQKESFDKQSFFFLTCRSEVAASCLIDKDNDSNYVAKFFVVNPKHYNKNVEEGMVSLLLKRAEELKLEKLYFDPKVSNLQEEKIKELGFIKE